MVHQLVDAGHHVRALTRNPAKAGLPEGVEVVGGDVALPATLTSVFDGVTAAHLINFGGGGHYAPSEVGAEIVELAVKAGVRRVTMLAGYAEGTLEPAVKASELEWASISPNEFMSNALMWVWSIRAQGVVEKPFGNTRTPMVHEVDIAAVAVRALTEDGHHGKTYLVTGPELLNMPEKVAILAEAIGREIRFVELTRDQARERMLRQGLSEELTEFTLKTFGDVSDDAYSVLPTVEEVTGRAPRTFAQWAAENADAFS